MSVKHDSVAGGHMKGGASMVSNRTTSRKRKNDSLELNAVNAKVKMLTHGCHFSLPLRVDFHGGVTLTCVSANNSPFHGFFQLLRWPN